MSTIQLPRWARISIALACVAIGLASSTVNGWLLVRGLELTEPDSSSRTILTASGVLMITVELVAFFLAALLPAAQLRRLRIMGLALWLFGCITIFGTRLVLNHNAESAIAAQATRLDNVRQAIASRLADADRVRANGERQGASANAWARHLGAMAIKQADAMERDIEPLRDELANLQAEQRTTLLRVLGPELALVHSVAMPVLISSLGLVLFGVAGMMLRRVKTDGDTPLQPTVTTQQSPQAPPLQPEQTVTPHRSAVPHGAIPAVPPTVNPMTNWRSITAAIPLAAMSAAPTVIASPAVAPRTKEPATASPFQEITLEATPEIAPTIEIEPAVTALEQSTVAAVTAVDVAVTAAVTGQDDCYQRLRSAVLAGEIKPSVRALNNAGWGSIRAASRYLKQLADEGVIVKEGQGYALALNRSESIQ